MIFTNGDSREIGLYDLPWSIGLLGFKIGMIRPVFHTPRICRLVNDKFIRSVMNCLPFGPKCFNMIGASPSGPIAFEFFDVAMASATSMTSNAIPPDGASSWIFLQSFYILFHLWKGAV